MNDTSTGFPMDDMPMGDIMTMESSALMDRREKALSIVPHISGALSMLGDVLITCRILQRYRTKEGLQSYHYIMLAMTSVDFLSSFAYAFGGTASPPGMGPGMRPRYRAYGTDQTCTAQGFFIQFGMAVAFLNLLLSFHYLAVIRYQIREAKLRKWTIPTLVLVFAIGLALSVPLVFMDAYASNVLWCWIGPKYNVCLANGVSPKECVDKFVLLTNMMYYFPLWLCVGLATIVQGVIFWSVRSIDVKANRWRMRNVISGPAKEQEKKGHHSKKRRKRKFSSSRMVAVQSVLYLSCFYIAWTPMTVALNVFANENAGKKNVSILEGKYFWMFFLAAFLQPIQGFLNCLVYFRKTIENWIRPKTEKLFSKCDGACCCYCKRKNSDDEEAADPENKNGSNGAVEEGAARRPTATTTSLASTNSELGGSSQFGEMPSDLYEE